MKRTQIQLPDWLYGKLKKMASSQEISLSELLRRAGEYFLATKPDPEAARSDWRTPEPMDLGAFRAEESDWRLQGNAPDIEGDDAQR